MKKLDINGIINNGDKLMKNNKVLLIIIGIILLILITVIIVILSLGKDPENEKIEESIDIEQLEVDFNELFNNDEFEYVGTLYQIEDEKSGKYKIEANIPYLHIETEIDNKINKEINDIFANKLLQIVNESTDYTILKIDYATNISKNIISLAIRCVLKEGNNAQRTIIKTYNYDIENKKEVDIIEVIPDEKKQDIQNQIDEEIEKQIKKEETIAQQGYSIYRRDRESNIYKLENAKEFYIKDNIVYIIYSYGNNNYTSEMDLIINKI